MFFLNFSFPFFSLRPLFDGKTNEKRNSSLSRDVAVIYEDGKKCHRINVTSPPPKKKKTVFKNTLVRGRYAYIFAQVNAGEGNTLWRHLRDNGVFFILSDTTYEETPLVRHKPGANRHRRGCGFTLHRRRLPFAVVGPGWPGAGGGKKHFARYFAEMIGCG